MILEWVFSQQKTIFLKNGFELLMVSIESEDTPCDVIRGFALLPMSDTGKKRNHHQKRSPSPSPPRYKFVFEGVQDVPMAMPCT